MHGDASDDYMDGDEFVDLPRRSVRGGAAVLIAQGMVFILGLGSAAVLARLLTPDDYGLIGMAGAFIAIIMNFADLGLPLATVQQKRITNDQVNSLFWITFGFGLLSCLLGCLLAWPVAVFYETPALIPVVIGLALGFIFTGLGAQQEALLRRAMRFTQLSVVSVVSNLVGIVLAITAALLGAGYWSLVILALGTSVSRCAMFWMLCSWRPSAPSLADGLAPMVRFGSYITGTNLLATLVRNVDKILIGRMVGADAVGYYMNASRLLVLPISQLNKPLSSVAVPTLSRLQNEPERYRDFYRRGVEGISAMTVPAVVFFLITADFVIPVVLGDQWLPAIPIFKALAPAALLAGVNIVTAWVFIPLGHSDRQFRWHVFRTIVVLIAYGVGVNWGAFGVAVGFSVSAVILRVPAVLWCIKGTCIRFQDVVNSVWRAFAAAGCAAVAGTLVAVRFDPAVDRVLPLVLTFAAFAGCYAICWIALPGGLTRFRAFRTSLAHLMPGRSATED